MDGNDEKKGNILKLLNHEHAKENKNKLHRRETRARGRERPAEKGSKTKVVLTAVILLVIATATGLGICSDRLTDAYKARTSFDSETAARIGKDKISVAEFMLTSVDIKNGYETQYGSDIWTQKKKNAQGETETYERIAKEDILEQIRFIKAMGKEGSKRKIKLTDGENKTLNETAKSYYSDLKKAGVGDEVTLKDVRGFYKDNYYAQKVYYKITGDNTVTEAATGSSVSADSSETSAAQAQEIWTKYVNKWYPNFDYKLDINWNILDQIKFANDTESSTKSTETSTESNESTESSNKDSEKSSNTQTESEDK